MLTYRSGQIMLPSFIAEMRDPREFPKVLVVVTVCELIVFTLAGALMYFKLGQYTTGTNPTTRFATLFNTITLRNPVT
jgi:hypothetical protein